MKKCPNCDKNSIGYDNDGIEKCIYTDCGWKNRENLDLDNLKKRKVKK